VTRRATARPRFTLALLYFFAAFFVFCLALAAPALFEVWRGVSPGPEQEEAARRATQEVLRGRIPWAAAAAAVSVGLLGFARALPGLRGS
jgi:hypothetical protein